MHRGREGREEDSEADTFNYFSNLRRARKHD